MSNFDEDTPTAPAGPVQCAQGCGFYGNPLTENMCSKCYKQVQAEHCPPVPIVPVVPQPEVNAENVDEAMGEAKPEVPSMEEKSSAEVCAPVPDEAPETMPEAVAEKKEGEAPTPPKKPIQKNKKRCWTCKKKVGLMGFECKCDFIFCAEHRYAEAHACPHDYMTEQRAKLKQDNPTVQADKLNRI